MNQPAQPANPPEAHNRTALILYLLTLLAVPFCGPLMKLTGGVENPFLFNAFIRAGIASSTLIAAAAIYGPWIWRNRRILRRHLPGTLAAPAALLMVPALNDTVLLGYSAQMVDLSTAIVVQELHPIATILMSLWLWRGTGNYRTSAARLAILIPACLTSLALLAGAEAGSVAKGLGLHQDSAARILPGLGLAFLMTFLASSTAITGRHCARRAQALAQETGEPDTRYVTALLFAAVFTAACCTSSATCFAGAALAGEHMTRQQALASLLITGMLTCFLGSITWRTALLITDNLSLNALLYLNGPLSLAFLWTAGLVHVASPAHLAAGAALALSANIGANLPDPRRMLRRHDRSAARG